MVAEVKHNIDQIVELKRANSSVKIHLHGATILSWTVDGKDLLFLSSKALMDGSKPIRGGIPLVFPQFGTGPIMAGQHGFARNSKWKIVEGTMKESSCTFELKYNEDTLKLWNNKFKLLYTVELMDKGLRVEFEVVNEDESKFDFTALLHTYFNIGSIETVKIDGLGNLKYADKLKNGQVSKEERSIINNICEEVDRNYFRVSGPVKLSNSNANFVLESDFEDLVLWNPWIEKSRSMADFGDDEYKKMICLEFGRVGEVFSLAPNERFVRQQTIRYMQ